MLSYFFHRGLVVTINSDDDTKARQRAYEIAAERIAPFNEEPRLVGHATLPADGVVVTWDRYDSEPAEAGVNEDTVHSIVGDEIEKLRSELQGEIDRVESRVDDIA